MTSRLRWLLGQQTGAFRRTTRATPSNIRSRNLAFAEAGMSAGAPDEQGRRGAGRARRGRDPVYGHAAESGLEAVGRGGWEPDPLRRGRTDIPRDHDAGEIPNGIKPVKFRLRRSSEARTRPARP